MREHLERPRQQLHHHAAAQDGWARFIVAHNEKTVRITPHQTGARVGESPALRRTATAVFLVGRHPGGSRHRWRADDGSQSRLPPVIAQKRPNQADAIPRWFLTRSNETGPDVRRQRTRCCRTPHLNGERTCACSEHTAGWTKVFLEIG